MASITINFAFSDGSTDSCEFEATSGLLGEIADYTDDKLDALNSDSVLGIQCIRSVVESTDTDIDPADFDGLGQWGDYCEAVDEHGEAYALRYNDIGSCSMDEYQGCYDSEEDFGERYFDDMMECPENLRQYIDLDYFTKELMHDFSAYDGVGGVHIFSN